MTTRKFRLGIPHGFTDLACFWAFCIGCWPLWAWLLVADAVREKARREESKRRWSWVRAERRKGTT